MTTKIVKKSTQQLIDEAVSKAMAELLTKVTFPHKMRTQGTRTESMEALGSRLLREKATAEQIENAFKSAYLLKGKTDMTFIRPRIVIYMDIARKRNKQWLIDEAVKEQTAKTEAQAKRKATIEANKAKQTAKVTALQNMKAEKQAANSVKPVDPVATISAVIGSNPKPVAKVITANSAQAEKVLQTATKLFQIKLRRDPPHNRLLPHLQK